MSIILHNSIELLLAGVLLILLIVVISGSGPPPPMVPVAQPFCAPARVSVLNDAGNSGTFCGDSPDIQMRNT